MMNISRNDFIKQLATSGAAFVLSPTLLSSCKKTNGQNVPSYLSGYGDLYAKDPHAAALSWWKKAGFGLFLHYGLYSLLENGEWVQFNEKMPVSKYEKLKEKFTAKHFDPDFITDLAIDAGMKYVNITAKHHDGFCLFKTAQTNYSSVNSPAKRDLVGELREVCAKKGLGLFLYYSIAADWHHPYFLPTKAGWFAYRPHYPKHQSQYRFKTLTDFQKYLTYAKAQIKELVTQYRPAGIWFDPIMGFYARPDLFPMVQIYEDIHTFCSYTFVSFKQGATGTEDFAAPERDTDSLYSRVKQEFGKSSAQVAKKAWQSNRKKHNETCNTLQPSSWGYDKDADGKHKDAEQVLNLLRNAHNRDLNLLLNTGPLPNGRIYRGDVNTLREVGKTIRMLSEN